MASLLSEIKALVAICSASGSCSNSGKAFSSSINGIRLFGAAPCFRKSEGAILSVIGVSAVGVSSVGRLMPRDLGRTLNSPY